MLKKIMNIQYLIPDCKDESILRKVKVLFSLLIRSNTKIVWLSSYMFKRKLTKLKTHSTQKSFHDIGKAENLKIIFIFTCNYILFRFFIFILFISYRFSFLIRYISIFIYPHLKQAFGESFYHVFSTVKLSWNQKVRKPL